MHLSFFFSFLLEGFFIMYLLSCSKGKKNGNGSEDEKTKEKKKKRTAVLTWIYGLYSFCY